MGRLIGLNYKYVLLDKVGVWVALFYHPENKISVSWATSLENVDRMLNYTDAMNVMRNLLAKGWEVKEREDIKGHEIERKVSDLQEMQRMRNKALQTTNH